jgi:hypothetical protein
LLLHLPISQFTPFPSNTSERSESFLKTVHERPHLAQVPRSAFDRFLAQTACSWDRPQRALRVEPVRKLQRVFSRTYFVRFFEPPNRLEAKKSQRISLCAIVCKNSLGFCTASVHIVPSASRRIMAGICAWPLYVAVSGTLRDRPGFDLSAARRWSRAAE